MYTNVCKYIYIYTIYTTYNRIKNKFGAAMSKIYTQFNKGWVIARI